MPPTLLFFACLLFLLIALTVIVTRQRHVLAPERVHCLCVTGKDDLRVAFARHTVFNFLQQTDARKRLVIVNHHPTQSVLSSPGLYPDVVEIRVSKVGELSTLGDLRNLALSTVPDGDLWVPWDDDDWRAPEYLASLRREITQRSGC